MTFMPPEDQPHPTNLESDAPRAAAPDMPQRPLGPLAIPDPGPEPLPSNMRKGVPPSFILMLFLLFVGAEVWAYIQYTQPGGEDLPLGSVDMAIPEGVGAFFGFFFLTWVVGGFHWMGGKLRLLRFLCRIKAPWGLVDRSRVGGEQLAGYQRVATERVNLLVEMLIYDFGRLLAGQHPELGHYVAPQVVTVLNQLVAPVIRSGDRVRPEFGNHVEVTIEWNDADVRRPVTARALFVDMSSRVTAQGLPVQSPKRQMRMTIAVDHSFQRIIDASIGPV